ncbi:hypothetical protein DY000_02023620 [Brassica cretica]|uniref:G-patch domain-containing protein n=1 Tax=Brassica cretica TaxID=69181 RepID=A0ABQ7EHP6_BRACR|nr:hypothetical protein DY000_02023620 [Brassica cretica]
MGFETGSGLTREGFVTDSGEMRGENSDHVVGVLSPHESPERESEDCEIDNLKRNEGFPYPTTPFHLHSTAGKEGRHKNDFS